MMAVLDLKRTLFWLARDKKRTRMPIFGRLKEEPTVGCVRRVGSFKVDVSSSNQQ
jgi:hypothetical protein